MKYEPVEPQVVNLSAYYDNYRKDLDEDQKKTVERISDDMICRINEELDKKLSHDDIVLVYGLVTELLWSNGAFADGKE